MVQCDLGEGRRGEHDIRRQMETTEEKEARLNWCKWNASTNAQYMLVIRFKVYPNML